MATTVNAAKKWLRPHAGAKVKHPGAGVWVVPRALYSAAIASADAGMFISSS